MGRAAGDAPTPSHHIPDDGTDQRTKDHMQINHARVYHALAYGRRHAVGEDEKGNAVKEGRKSHGMKRFEHACGNHGGDRVGGIMKTIHEVKHQGQHDQHEDDPQAWDYCFHSEFPA